MGPECRALPKPCLNESLTCFKFRFVSSPRICSPRATQSSPQDTLGDVIDWTYSGNKLHPTQKPLSALLPLVETFSVPQGTVLDPFTGSGSSLLAAKMLGRSYVGIELDAKYHTIASRRLGQAVS